MSKCLFAEETLNETQAEFIFFDQVEVVILSHIYANIWKFLCQWRIKVAVFMLFSVRLGLHLSAVIILDQANLSLV